MDDVYESEYGGGQGGPSTEMIDAAHTSIAEFQEAERAGGQVGAPREFMQAEYGQAQPQVVQQMQPGRADVPARVPRVRLSPIARFVTGPAGESWYQRPGYILGAVALFFGGLYLVSKLARR